MSHDPCPVEHRFIIICTTDYKADNSDFLHRLSVVINMDIIDAFFLIRNILHW